MSLGQRYTALVVVEWLAGYRLDVFLERALCFLTIDDSV